MREGRWSVRCLRLGSAVLFDREVAYWSRARQGEVRRMRSGCTRGRADENASALVRQSRMTGSTHLCPCDDVELGDPSAIALFNGK